MVMHQEKTCLKNLNRASQDAPLKAFLLTDIADDIINNQNYHDRLVIAAKKIYPAWFQSENQAEEKRGYILQVYFL